MKTLALAFPLVALGLAACTPTDQSTAVGALGGAAIGAAVSSDSDRTRGALAGAAVGAQHGALLLAGVRVIGIGVGVHAGGQGHNAGKGQQKGRFGHKRARCHCFQDPPFGPGWRQI